MNWFDIRNPFSGVYAFMEPGHYEECISYLVVGTERAALVDTGMNVGDLAAAVRQVTSLPITVVNTHADWDHRGENYKFSDIAIHKLEADVLERPVGQEKLSVKSRPGRFTRPTPPDFVASEWRVPPSKATRLLHDGDKIELGGRTLEVIHTPGHTPGHVCLLDRAQRWLITGDLYYPGAIYVFYPWSSLSDCLTSARRMAALKKDVDWLLPAHNVTPIPETELTRLQLAFENICNGTAQGVERDDAEWGHLMKYEFGTLSVLTRA
jgi:glyoxylase-like metal-dependent hydrolase (beta-lactamase superfamily II)